jgi:hypothetical protein
MTMGTPLASTSDVCFEPSFLRSTGLGPVASPPSTGTVAGAGWIGPGDSPGSLAANAVSPPGTVSGTYTATFPFDTHDENLPGGTVGKQLLLTAKVVVVPEPATLVLAGLGAGLLAAWRRHRARREPGVSGRQPSPPETGPGSVAPRAARSASLPSPARRPPPPAAW